MKVSDWSISCIEGLSLLGQYGIKKDSNWFNFQEIDQELAREERAERKRKEKEEREREKELRREEEKQRRLKEKEEERQRKEEERLRKEEAAKAEKEAAMQKSEDDLFTSLAVEPASLPAMDDVENFS